MTQCLPGLPLILRVRHYVRELDELVARAERCNVASGELGDGLLDARRAVDELNRLLDMVPLTQHPESL